MNYEKIIIELLSRIQILEDKMGISPQKNSENGEIAGNATALFYSRNKDRITTSQLKMRIKELLESEKQAGKEYAELICGVLHKKWELKNAVPMICNAMKACMNAGDTVIFRSPSGYSATLKIRYNFSQAAATPAKPALKDVKAEIKQENKAEIKQETAPSAAPPAVIKTTPAAISPERPQSKPESSPEAKIEKHAQPVTKAAPLEIKPAPQKKPLNLSIDAVWSRIVQHEWVIFYLPDGGEFAFVAGNDYLGIVRTNFRLPRADIEKALALFPFKNTVPLQHLRYPSYIYSILTDERITGAAALEQ